jgi:uncharacterized protein (TIGR02996 family)
MGEDESFLAAISAARDDDTLRLIYADWLEERGDVRSEYLRLLSALAALPQRQTKKRKPLQARFQQLRATIDPDWQWSVARRKSLDETWRYLEAQGEEMPRDPDGRPFVPPQMPSFDDEAPLGLSYFKSGLEDADRSGLTMPRTFVGRSGFSRVRFTDSDLSESRMCWNDFEHCDFSGADLSRCDMRAATFTGCKFVGAILRGVDFHRSYFKDCDFTGADLTGAVAEGGILYTRSGHTGVADFLTIKQQAVMTWTPDEGPEPPGG